MGQVKSPELGLSNPEWVELWDGQPASLIQRTQTPIQSQLTGNHHRLYETKSQEGRPIGEIVKFLGDYGSIGPFRVTGNQERRPGLQAIARTLASDEQFISNSPQIHNVAKL